MQALFSLRPPVSQTAATPVLKLDDRGLYCAAGDFYIDPWGKTDKALITHAHADHARPGQNHYYSHPDSVAIMRKRLGDQLQFTGVEYGESLTFGDAHVSFHPAGHVLGSAQIRVEVDGEVWVASGDYKRDDDPTCAPFEVIPCDTFITEATFGLPVYRWKPTSEVAKDILAWWQFNASQGVASVLFCYAFGKAQRVLAELMAITNQTIYLHGAVDNLTRIYRDLGVQMLPTEPVIAQGRQKTKQDYSQSLVIAPPGANGTPWMRRFGKTSTGFASGWMQVRGNRRRRGHDRGFVISDHADWPSLLSTIKETGAEQILITHGQSDILRQYLVEQGVNARALETYYRGDDGEDEGIAKKQADEAQTVIQTAGSNS